VIHHISFTVSNVKKSKAFYVEALRALGIHLILEVSAASVGGPIHTAFCADSRARAA
jgi:catechol 2,3-dioxygenase-like lactoylglutathione lyase family enzyme